MDEFTKKVEDLLKSLLSIKTGASKDLFVPTIKPIKTGLPKFPIKQPSVAKIPSALPPPSKKDPVKVAEQLKNPNPGKVNVEVLKVENNGQWSLTKSTKIDRPITPTFVSQQAANKAPVHAENEGFANHYSPKQKKLIHGLNIHNMEKLRGGSAAGGTHKASNPEAKTSAVVKRASTHANREERGHLENGFNSSKREVLFHNMAHNFFGMGKHVPTTSGFSRDGEDYSAMEFQEKAHHPDFEEHDEFFDDNLVPQRFKYPTHAKTLTALHENGDLHKLALMDNILGHHDRHSGNMMIDANQDRLHLIDNGTSFDYGNFDTKHYPAYLRHSGSGNIEGMGLDNSKLHPDAIKWLNGLDPQKAEI